MKIKFWGVQGSTPNPLSGEQLQKKIKEILRRAHGRVFTSEQEFQNFFDELPFPLMHITSGNTTCFEILSDRGPRLIIDMGSGARKLGLELMKGPAGRGKASLTVLMTHLHLDHIMGFPFFMPAYTPGNRITFYGGHDYLEEALGRQVHPQLFPVALKDMGAELRFHTLPEGEELAIEDFRITCKRLQHPGGSYAYRVTEAGKSLVIATDAEYKELDAEALRPYVDFYRDAKLLIFDAQYTLKDVITKIDWGHSSSFIGVDICLLANVEKLVMTHHDPSYDDDKMKDILQRTENFKQEALKQSMDFAGKKLEVVTAYEGLEISV
jgi:phosphoribosyl 1,2-cyclic phosphodiesterase